jgi:hypothetical protein
MTTTVSDAEQAAADAKAAVDDVEEQIVSGTRSVTAAALHRVRDVWRHADLSAQGARQRAEADRRAARMAGLEKIGAAVDTLAAGEGATAAMAGALRDIAAACERLRSLAADHDAQVADLIAAAADLGAEAAAPGGPRPTSAHVAVRDDAIVHGSTGIRPVGARIAAAVGHAVAGDTDRAITDVQTVTYRTLSRPDYLIRGSGGQLLAFSGELHAGIAAQVQARTVQVLSEHDIDLYMKGELV